MFVSEMIIYKYLIFFQLESRLFSVYILGAGFSRDANMPLVSDFLEQMKDSLLWLKDNRRHLEASAIERVLEFRRDALASGYWTQIDLENIEELFSLSAATHLLSTDPIQTAIRRAIAGTLLYCSKKLPPKPVTVRIPDSPPWAKAAKWIKGTGEIQMHHAPLYAHNVAKLLGMCRTGRITGKNTFITLNYDTVLEEALRELDVTYDYGLGKKSVQYNGTDRSTRGNCDVDVLKLHGSINWARPKGRRGGFEVYGGYENIDPINAIPELIPPTWSKVFGPQLASTWNSAKNALENATRIVVIGFSLPPTDTHFKYLLGAGLRKNISLRRIHFFDRPGAIEGVKARAERLLRPQYIADKRIAFHGCELGQLTCVGSNGLNDALSKIGRPAWQPGDTLGFQWEHESFRTPFPLVPDSDDFPG